MPSASGARVALGILVGHERRRVVGGNVDRAPAVAVDVAAHEHGRVLRPVALVVVELERPLDLHLVRLHPVDLGVPAAVHRGTERIDVAVLRTVGVEPLVLVEVFAAVVRWRRHARAGPESGRVVAASVRPERAADLAGEDVDLRTADLDRLDVQQVVVRPRVVVGHHDLALELAVGVEEVRGLVEVESGDDRVRDHLLDAGRRDRLVPVARREYLGIAEELHELAREVDAGGVVGLVGPVDAARTPLAGRGDDVGHLDFVAVRQHPGERKRSAGGDIDGLSRRVEKELLVGHQAGVDVGEETLVGRRPVDAGGRIELVADVVLRLGPLQREARLRRGHRHPGQARGRDGRHGVRPRRHHAHHGIGAIAYQPLVLGGIGDGADFRRSRGAQGEMGGRAQRRRERQGERHYREREFMFHHLTLMM